MSIENAILLAEELYRLAEKIADLEINGSPDLAGKVSEIADKIKGELIGSEYINKWLNLDDGVNNVKGVEVMDLDTYKKAEEELNEVSRVRFTTFANNPDLEPYWLIVHGDGDDRHLIIVKGELKEN